MFRGIVMTGIIGTAMTGATVIGMGPYMDPLDIMSLNYHIFLI